MKKKFDYKKLTEQAELLGILLCIFLLILVIFSWYSGFHNIDLIFNVRTMTDTVNSANLHGPNNTPAFMDFSKIMDTANDGITRPLSSYYITSMNTLKNYTIAGFIDCIILGLLIARRFK